MTAVELDIEKFRTNHPQFADEGEYPDSQIEMCFDFAVSLVGNGADCLVPYDPEKYVFDREKVLDLATCHVLSLLSQPDGGQGGRIASASQGSVSTSFDLYKTGSKSGDWWAQTQCGTLYWMLMARYRIGGRFYGLKVHHPWG